MKRRQRSQPEPTTEPSLALGKTLDFMQLLWAVDHALQASSARMADQIGVTGPQRLVLRIVGLKPGISAGELAETMHLHPSTMTGILRRLVVHRFLRRTQDPEDGRRALFDLTDQGRKVNDVRTETIEAAVRRALTAAAPRRVAAARMLLERLALELKPER
jgi:MarR family transcriptional regulator, organic hydroperoxide resistance regulator